jgi:hypothetical protein
VNAVEDSTERPAEPGELCTCGRQARTVFITRRWGEVGSCDTDNSGQRPILPCPFCRATEAHQVGGEIVKCPQYRLRGLDDLTASKPLQVLDLGDAEAAAIRRDVLAWLKSYVQDDEVPDVLVAMYQAAEQWERQRPQGIGPEWWAEYQRWQRVRDDDAVGLIWRLDGNVRGHAETSP